MEMTGAEVICRILKGEGVKYVFGVPGNSEVPLLDALAQTPGIRYVSAVHESVSMAMADSYALASGKVGVALATSRTPVVALVGDGSALFGIQALWTAAKYQIPVIIVVLNNRGYAAIKWGFASYPLRGSEEGADLGYDLGNVDFAQLAKVFGISGQRITDAAQIGPAMERAIGSGKPALLDLLVDPKDIGYGMPRLS